MANINHLTFNPGLTQSHNATSDPKSEQKSDRPRMIGDFDSSSNELWTLFQGEAKNHDDARIYALKEDMEGALVFVRSYTYKELGYTDVWPHRPVYLLLPSLHS